MPGSLIDERSRQFGFVTFVDFRADAAWLDIETERTGATSKIRPVDP
jgi:hypothetical protein